MNQTDYMTGAELQALREACGLDRDQFGELCGVQGRSVKYWEMRSGVPADVANLVLELLAKVEAKSAAMFQAWKPDTILLRTSDPLHNQAVSRLFLTLRHQGREVRIASLDYKDFRDWLHTSNKRDTPEARQAWARMALKEQARPHRQDQPV